MRYYVVRFTRCLSLYLWVLLLGGCLYQSDGIFKQIGTSDYKARMNVQGVFVVADGCPTYIGGRVLKQDGVKPVSFAQVVLKQHNTVVARTQTDHSGGYLMQGAIEGGVYELGIESSEYVGGREVTVRYRKGNHFDLTVSSKAPVQR